MILYLLVITALTLGLCGLMFRVFDHKIKRLAIKLDDGRGYYLVSVLLIAFLGAISSYYLGSWLGYDQHPEQQGRLVAAILLNAVIALLALTYGLIRFKEGERYR